MSVVPKEKGETLQFEAMDYTSGTDSMGPQQTDQSAFPQVLVAQSTLELESESGAAAGLEASGVGRGPAIAKAAPQMNGASVHVNDERGRQDDGTYGAVHTEGPAAQMRSDRGVSAYRDERKSGLAPETSEAASMGIGAGAQGDVQDIDGEVGPAYQQTMQRGMYVPEDPFLGQSGGSRDSRDQMSAGFLTPRSMRAAWSDFQAARTGVGPEPEVWPKWVQRLSGFFRPPQIPTAWMPSPMPSPLLDRRSGGSVQDHVAAQSMGDPRMNAAAKTPAKAVTAIPRPPTPPSSSSLPAEAIQAEVQRQLGGLLDRLRQSEAETARLQRLLSEATAAPRVPLQPPLPEEEPPARVATETVPPEREENLGDVHGGAREGSRRDLLGSLWDEISGRIGSVQASNQSMRKAVSVSRLPSPPPQKDDNHVQPPLAPSMSSSGPPNLLDAIAKGVQQLQELQVQTLKREEDGSPEQVKSSMTSLPALKAPQGDMAGVRLQDWLALVSTCMQDLSAGSGLWWQEVLQRVSSAYMTWLAATPLERLQVQPAQDDPFIVGKWTRVNARACTLVLGAVDESLKEDLVSRRATTSIIAMLFRLHTVYQPGGPHERSRVLRALQEPQTPENLTQALALLRNWPRSMQRCQDMGMSFPDSTVLAKALTTSGGKFITESPDAAFRTQLLRSSLRIDGQPSLDSVHKYHQHLQAEIENMAATNVDQGGPRLRAMKTGDGGHAEQSSSAKATAPCRYFFKSQGCRRGAKCPYGHDMGSLSKFERAKKCLQCGSEDHRQRDCPTTRTSRTSKGYTETAAKDASPSASSTSGPRVQKVTFEESATAEDAATVKGDPVWTMEALLKAAAQVIQTSNPEPEPKAPSMKVMRLGRREDEHLDAEDVYALMDSGATHPLRRAWSQEEWQRAEPTVVTLAGGESVELRMHEGGTILVPISTEGYQAPTAPIVPLGSLVQQLGYTLEWSAKKCRLVVGIEEMYIIYVFVMVARRLPNARP